jgi:uncharacterized protein YbjT (DUF2867 family)
MSVYAGSVNAPESRLIAVAGGTGFVGGAIARELSRRGYRVVVLTHRPPKPEAPPAPGFPVAGVRTADVTEPETLAAALAGVDALVVSLAFPNSPIEAPRRGRTFEKVDAAGTEALAKAAAGAGVGRLIYISGAGAAADAPRHWFRAKWRAEVAVRASGIPYTIFRPSWIYGAGDKSLNRFLSMGRFLPFIPQIGNGRQILVPLFVDDIGSLVADALETDATINTTLEAGGPESVTMDEVIRRALHAAHRRRMILHAPVGLVKLMVRPLTLLPSPPMTPDAVDFIVQSAPVDTTALHALLPRPLTPLSEALARYLG